MSKPFEIKLQQAVFDHLGLLGDIATPSSGEQAQIKGAIAAAFRQLRVRYPDFAAWAYYDFGPKSSITVKWKRNPKPPVRLRVRKGEIVFRLSPLMVESITDNWIESDSVDAYDRAMKVL